MKVGLSIIDNKECNELYKQDIINARFFKQGIVDSMLCAGELQGGKDTCLVSLRVNNCLTILLAFYDRNIFYDFIENYSSLFYYSLGFYKNNYHFLIN